MHSYNRKKQRERRQRRVQASSMEGEKERKWAIGRAEYGREEEKRRY